MFPKSLFSALVIVSLLMTACDDGDTVAVTFDDQITFQETFNIVTQEKEFQSSRSIKLETEENVVDIEVESMGLEVSDYNGSSDFASLDITVSSKTGESFTLADVEMEDGKTQRLDLTEGTDMLREKLSEILSQENEVDVNVEVTSSTAPFEVTIILSLQGTITTTSSKD